MRYSLVVVRWLTVLLVAFGLSACSAAQVVDCTPGVFLRADDDSWCVLPGSTTARCPDLLPEEHRLGSGARGCASRRHDPLPPGLCVAAGFCGGDAGP